MNNLHPVFQAALEPFAPPRFNERGYDVEAGKERIRADRRQELARNDRLTTALQVLAVDVHNESEILWAMHAMAASFKAHAKPMPGSDGAELLALLVEATESIQFRGEPV